MVILTAVRFHLTVDLVCISMMAKMAALFCVYLFVICTSFKKYCLGSFAHSLLDSFWIFDRPVSLVLFPTIEQVAVESSIGFLRFFSLGLLFSQCSSKGI